MRGLNVLAGIGTAGLIYAAAVEPRLFRLRHYCVPVLPPGAQPLRILHISDIHLTRKRHYARRWISQLAEVNPDLVINTGDNLAENALDELLETLQPLLKVPGFFCLGSNDFYAARMRNPLRYVVRGSSAGDALPAHPDLPVDELITALTAHGWRWGDNRSAQLTIKGTRIHLFGVGDAHINRDSPEAMATERSSRSTTQATDDREQIAAGSTSGEIKLGITHSPYTRVLDTFVDNNSDLVMAGHTHGGQIRIPGYGAPVTNCDLARNQARGLFTYRGMPVEVSAGLGFSPYAPVRFACRPEASLVELVSR